jgi:hypothetical protein
MVHLVCYGCSVSVSRHPRGAVAHGRDVPCPGKVVTQLYQWEQASPVKIVLGT